MTYLNFIYEFWVCIFDSSYFMGILPYMVALSLISAAVSFIRLMSRW